MTTFALIHGGGGSGWDFHRLVPELAARGHDAVTPDLPITDPAAGLAEFTETVLAALGDRTDVAVVGHSYGGFTAPLVAAKVRARVLVYLAGMIPAPGEQPGQWWGNTGFAAPTGLSEAEQFFNGVDPSLADECQAHGRDQVSKEWDEPWPLPAHPDVPTRALLFRDDRFFTPDFQRRVARSRLGVEPDEADGPHCAPLSHPAAIAEKLVSYL
ncbi:MULTISPECIES: alpha/beta fold hydrolase [unclassified Amycolatopsis]|uniref:alpha/beta fold hydrolase n=1 Tax=unclassified Amycolatopsis TaxID=2618356 RepID=UPI002E1082C1|nr:MULTISPECIES: alpha/beta hydrolase family protein [unclassified Amycolatopsis]WSK80780.1 alpha/beta fold hydrolase [Amycolatopsis sp. NBC_01286]